MPAEYSGYFIGEIVGYIMVNKRVNL